MEYNLEEFKDKRTKITTPIVTIHSKSILSYSACFIRKYNLKDCNGVNYYYDKNKNVLAISFCIDNYLYKLGINKNKNSLNRTSSIGSFIIKNKIEIPLTLISTPEVYKDKKLGRLFIINFK